MLLGIVLIVVLFISFILAWRSLVDLEAPKGVYESIGKPVGKVKKWATTVFTKGKQIYYSEE